MALALKPDPSTSDIVELTRGLVAAGQPWCENSLDGPLRPPEETRAAEYIAPLLRDIGFEVELVGRLPTRLNLVARRYFGPGPTLMLNDHLDTYPSGPPSRWKVCEDPYRVVEADGRLYSRGTSDTRGNLAALLLAASDLAYRPPEAGTLLVALTVDEERNGVEGAVYLTQERGIRADASITVEPTAWRDGDRRGMGLAVQHTGHALVDVRINGRSSHIWRPDTGINPAGQLISAVSLLSDGLPDGWGVSVVRLDAGEAGMAQFTPLTATARLAIVGVGPDTARGELRQIVHDQIRAALASGTDIEVGFAPGPTFVPGTVALAGEEPIVRALGDAYTEHTHEPIRHYTKPAYCDTIRFRHAGIPAVTFGPGEDGWAVYDESIAVDHIATAVRVLSSAARQFLRRGS